MSAFDQLAKIFKSLDESDSKAYSTHVEAIRRAIVDSNLVAQESGLGLVLVFLNFSPPDVSIK